MSKKCKQSSTKTNPLADRTPRWVWNPKKRLPELSKPRERALWSGFCRDSVTQWWPWRGVLIVMGIFSIAWFVYTIFPPQTWAGGRFAAVWVIAFNVVVYGTIFIWTGYFNARFFACCRARLRNLQGRPYFCHQCQYDIRRSCATTCPECGHPVILAPKHPRERWRVIWGRRIMNLLVTVSIVAAIAVVVNGVADFMRWW